VHALAVFATGYSHLFHLFSKMGVSADFWGDPDSSFLSGSVVTAHFLLGFMFRSTECFFVFIFCGYVYNYSIKILTIFVRCCCEISEFIRTLLLFPQALQITIALTEDVLLIFFAIWV